MSNTLFSPSYVAISHLEPPSWTREVNISQPWLSQHCSSLEGEMVCLQYFWFYLLTPSSLAESAYMKLIWMEQNKPVQGIFSHYLEIWGDMRTTLWCRHYFDHVKVTMGPAGCAGWNADLTESSFPQSKEALLVLKLINIFCDLEQKLTTPFYCSASWTYNNKFHIRSSL